MKRVKEKIQFKLLTLCLLSLGEGIKGRGLFLFLLFFFSLPFGEGWGGASSFAQNYPIQITTQLAPPFSGFIPDYCTPGNQNLKLLVVFTDFTKPSYNIKLKLQITGQGITIQSKRYYYSGPITLQPGTPIEISGSDLSGLLNSANLDFSDITPQKYQTNSLPEGYYNICFTAYDDEDAGALEDNREQILELLAKIKDAYKKDIDLSLLEYKPLLMGFYRFAANLTINGVHYCA